MAGALTGYQFWDGLRNSASILLRGDSRAAMIYLLEEIATEVAAGAIAPDVTLGVTYIELAGVGALTTIPAGARSFTIHNSGPGDLPGSWGSDLASGLGLTYTADAAHEVLPVITFTAPAGTTVEYATTTR